MLDKEVSRKHKEYVEVHNDALSSFVRYVYSAGGSKYSTRLVIAVHLFLAVVLALTGDIVLTVINSVLFVAFMFMLRSYPTKEQLEKDAVRTFGVKLEVERKE